MLPGTTDLKSRLLNLLKVQSRRDSRQKKPILLWSLYAWVLFVLPLSSCSSQNMSAADNKAFPGQSEVLQAQQQGLKHVEVTVDAQVYKLLRDDTEGLPHQRFLIGLPNGTTVLIAHDTKMAPRVPLNKGDWVRIHGEYIWTEKGGVIHWTHHTDTPRHEGGWIDYNGLRYQ